MPRWRIALKATLLAPWAACTPGFFALQARNLQVRAMLHESRLPASHATQPVSKPSLPAFTACPPGLFWPWSTGSPLAGNQHSCYRKMSFLRSLRKGWRLFLPKIVICFRPLSRAVEAPGLPAKNRPVRQARQDTMQACWRLPCACQPNHPRKRPCGLLGPFSPFLSTGCKRPEPPQMPAYSRLRTTLSILPAGLRGRLSRRTCTCWGTL